MTPTLSSSHTSSLGLGSLFRADKPLLRDLREHLLYLGHISSHVSHDCLHTRVWTAAVYLDARLSRPAPVRNAVGLLMAWLMALF